MYRLIYFFFITDSEAELENKMKKGRLKLTPSARLETETEDDSYSQRKIVKTKVLQYCQKLLLTWKLVPQIADKKYR